MQTRCHLRQIVTAGAVEKNIWYWPCTSTVLVWCNHPVPTSPQGKGWTIAWNKWSLWYWPKDRIAKHFLIMFFSIQKGQVSRCFFLLHQLSQSASSDNVSQTPIRFRSTFVCFRHLWLFQLSCMNTWNHLGNNLFDNTHFVIQSHRIGYIRFYTTS
jgi:hypothetical protein